MNLRDELRKKKKIIEELKKDYIPGIIHILI